MPDTRILIVVKDAEAGEAYTQALAGIGVSSDVAGSFEEMSAMAIRNRYNGFLVDILTLVRCSKDEKVIAYEVINLFPVLRVKWEPRHKKIKLSPLEQSFSPDTDSALRFFVEQRCKSFPARSLRRHQRRQVNLNLLYSLDPEFAEGSAHRSFTVNVGAGGVYLHAMHDFKEGDKLYLRFVEFPDQTPIPATVRWSQPWGETRCIPGVGIIFDALTAKQEKTLHRILNL